MGGGGNEFGRSLAQHPGTNRRAAQAAGRRPSSMQSSGRPLPAPGARARHPRPAPRARRAPERHGSRSRSGLLIRGDAADASVAGEAPTLRHRCGRRPGGGRTASLMDSGDGGDFDHGNRLLTGRRNGAQGRHDGGARARYGLPPRGPPPPARRRPSGSGRRGGIPNVS